MHFVKQFLSGIAKGLQPFLKPAKGRNSTSMTIPIPFTDIEMTLTLWELWGFTGTLLFSGRWFVQMHASRRAGHPVIPIAYWYMSLVGSFMLLSYFLSVSERVGIVSNLFPSFVASYNLFLELSHRRRGRQQAAESLEAAEVTG